MRPIALVCSVRLEAEPLLDHATKVRALGVRALAAWQAQVGDREVYIVISGMGKTNAARSLTALLAHRETAGVIGFGVAGAYRGSGLAVGDVALASIEHYGDEGVETPDGWMSCEGIGIPLLELPEARYFNDFPVDRVRLASALTSLAEAGRSAWSGPFVTVSACSGTTERGAVLEARYRAICETMEGAAYAHVAAAYGLPYLAVRGISNRVEDRDLAEWRLAEAASAAAGTLPFLVSCWDRSTDETSE